MNTIIPCETITQYREGTIPGIGEGIYVTLSIKNVISTIPLIFSTNRM